MSVGILELDDMLYIYVSILQEATRGGSAVAITAPDTHIPAIVKQQRRRVSICSYRSGFVMATILHTVTQQRLCIEVKMNQSVHIY